MKLVSSSPHASRTQTEIKFVYTGFIGAWFCFIFMIAKMNRPHRSISLWVLVACVFWTAYSIFGGFTMRRKFFRRSSESLSGEPRKALAFWKVAHFIGFCSAMSLTLLGVVLKFLGSGWIVAGIFLGLGLTFLLLWRPRQLAVSVGQPALC
jgi:hypothetical protein